MKVTINLTKGEVQHIYPGHTFYDCCSEVENIMKKVQAEIFKSKMKKIKKKKVKLNLFWCN